MTTDKPLAAGTSLFIPLYNEEEILADNIRLLLQHMHGVPSSHEIILGSNGSTDRTPEICRALSDSYQQISYFHLSLRGPGLAFRRAAESARYGHLVCIDADLSTDMDFIHHAAVKLREYDAVVGSKQNGAQKRKHLRILASKLFILCTNLLLDMPFLDYSIGAKAYRTACIRPFLYCVDRHTFYTQALLYHMQREGKRITEIPVACVDRRRSKFNLLHEGIYRFYRLFELWVRNCLK